MKGSNGLKTAKRLSLLAFVFVCQIQQALAQRDTTLFFRTNLNITQNGFSFIPSFSLGKPAVIFEPAIGNRRLSFEPQFRFALEGKPWSFIFIYRYQIRPDKRFRIQVGGHIPALVFSTHEVVRNGVTDDVIITNRYLAGELVPDYVFSERIRVGAYLLRGHGFDNGGVRDTYFAGVRSQITRIKILPRLFMKTTPMVYYLKTDNRDGTYITNTMQIALDNFPLSISNIINKAISSDIIAKDFDWNISLIYSFDKQFTQRN